MPKVSLVGNGHGGSEDYATLALWDAAESGVDYGSAIEAACLGDCGTNYTLSGTNVHGAVAYTLGVLYDGSNQSSLAATARVNVSGTDFTFKHIRITNNNAFDVAVDLSGANTYVEDSHIEDTSASGSSYGAAQVRGAAANKGLRRVTISANCYQLVRTGSGGPVELTNVTGWGATGRGILGPSGGEGYLTDCHFFDCNGTAVAGTFASKVNLASDDGTTAITPYTSAELVGFAGGDYRTKSSSFLATAGSGGSLIGAFLESGGAGISITPDSVDSASAANNPAITFNSVVNVLPLSIDSSSAALNPTIDFASVLNISPESIDSVSVSNDPTILFSSTLNITPSAIDSASASLDPTINFASLLQVSPTAIDSLSVANDPAITFTSALSISPSAIDSLSESLDPLVEFKSVINVTPQSIDSLSVSLNPFISTGEVQTIGNVTASFKNSGIGVKYKQNTITVNFN